jgi:hypothetical protein
VLAFLLVDLFFPAEALPTSSSLDNARALMGPRAVLLVWGWTKGESVSLPLTFETDPAPCFHPTSWSPDSMLLFCKSAFDLLASSSSSPLSVTRSMDDLRAETAPHSPRFEGIALGSSKSASSSLHHIQKDNWFEME